MNYKYFMKPKLSYIHTKSCCNDFEIGSLVANLAVSQNWIAAVKKMGHYPPKNNPTLVLFSLRWNVHMRERRWASEAWSERPLPSSSLTPVEVEMEEVVEVERGGPLHPPQGQLRWRWWSRRGSPPPHLRSHPSVKVKRLLGQATRSPRH